MTELKNLESYSDDVFNNLVKECNESNKRGFITAFFDEVEGGAVSFSVRGNYSGEMACAFINYYLTHPDWEAHRQVVFANMVAKNLNELVLSDVKGHA